MKLPAEVRQLLARRYETAQGDWLAFSDAEARWPMEISLGTPSEAAALRQPEAVRAWIGAWRTWQGKADVRWVERRWKVLGTQCLPETLLLAGPAVVADCVGDTQRWSRASARYVELTGRWPLLARRLARLYPVLADYPNTDFERLLAILDWLDRNPDSGLYPRQLPIAGVDSKWLESRRAVMTELLAVLRSPGGAAGTDFFSLSGLRRAPSMARMRVLDPALRASVGGLADLSAPVPQLASLTWQPSTVLIVENLQTGLALDDLPGTVAFMGLGYGAEVLAQLPWLRSANVLYWGDIDTHGFAILHRVRGALPHVHSLLMDEATLLRSRSLWSEEPTQHGATELSALTAEERALYQALKAQTFGQNVRLEQERIAWEMAWPMLLDARAS